MATLTMRIYNVRFGDGILISVPDSDENGDDRLRHILIDVGNVKSGEGGSELFKPVIEDVLDVLNGQPLDLYILSHEHLDHVKGLLWTNNNQLPADDLITKLDIQHVWMPASAHPDYYDTHPEAKKELDAAKGAYLGIAKFLAASEDAIPAKLEVLMKNNNRLMERPANAAGLNAGWTRDCVQFVRSLVDENHIHYIHRTIGTAADGTPHFDLQGTHPFRDASFEIWAPEEDSSEYYGSFKPMAMNVNSDNVRGRRENDPRQYDAPPPGVDAGAFYNLIDIRKHGYIDNLLEIDSAGNNSCIVFCLEWRGWRFLFPGDAELRSWDEMNKRNILSPVHFLKIGHHGSHNGTPAEDLLEKILPTAAPIDHDRWAAVSTRLDTYPGIPHNETFEELEEDFGCTVHSTLGLNDGEPIILDFEG